MKSRPILIAGAACVAAVCMMLLGGCTSGDGDAEPTTAPATEPATEPTTEPVSAIGMAALAGEWVLDGALHDAGGEAIPVPDTARPTLVVMPDGSVGGKGGVNRYTGRLDVDAAEDGAFDTGPVASTMMAGPTENMRVETRYLAAIAEAKTYEVVDGKLLLSNGDGDVILTFIRIAS